MPRRPPAPAPGARWSETYTDENGERRLQWYGPAIGVLRPTDPPEGSALLACPYCGMVQVFTGPPGETIRVRCPMLDLTRVGKVCGGLYRVHVHRRPGTAPANRTPTLPLHG